MDASMGAESTVRSTVRKPRNFLHLEAIQRERREASVALNNVLRPHPVVNVEGTVRRMGIFVCDIIDKALRFKFMEPSG